MPDMTGFVGGQWNAQCDICGRVFKSGQLITAWDQSKRCSDCFETRQPQDFVKATADDIATPWSRDWVPTYTAVANSSVAVGVAVVLPSLLVPIWLLTGGGAPVFATLLPLTANRIVTLTFDQAGTTVANGGNLILATGNYVVKSGDAFTFRCDGVKWREQSRLVS